MANITRQSPVKFDAEAVKTETRNHWTVALEYRNEGSGPWLADLAHKTRWDLQDRKIGGFSPLGIKIPESANQCVLQNDVLINRMNATQASIWHLGSDSPEIPNETGYTDTTEATTFLALFGPETFRITEKLTALDFMDPERNAPFLFQGPICRIPCQIVTLEKNMDNSGGILFSCSRGYAGDMVHAILEAGAEYNLRPAGENRFSRWLKTLAQK